MRIKSVVSAALISFVLALLPTSVSGVEYPGVDEPLKITGPLKLFEPCELGQLYSCIEYVGIINDEGKAAEIFTTGEPELVSFPFGYQHSYTGRVYDWKTSNIIHGNGSEVVKIKAFYWPWGLAISCSPYFSTPERLSCSYYNDQIQIDFEDGYRIVTIFY